MEITFESSRLVKPTYNGKPPSTNDIVTMNVFDKVTHNTHIAVIYAFDPPTPSNMAIEKGLSKALAEYRDFAGRLGEDAEGNEVIFLSDHGIRFVEATVNNELRNVLPSKPTKEIKNLHPSLDNPEELTQVQLTRFSCGSLVVGFTAHHKVGDGHSKSQFLVAWGLATRGLAIDPIPLHARHTLCRPRDPPLIQYDHHHTEYMNRRIFEKIMSTNESSEEEIVIHKVHFTSEFISKLQSKASAGVSKPFSRFVTALAHIWRVITISRGLHDDETTEIRISVNGRMRMDPKVPNEYFGNLVLWAFPRSKVRDLINEPLSYAAEQIRTAVAKVNDSYFKSFIDFASSDVVTKEDLVSTTCLNKRIISPDLDVDSWLTFPFFDLDFGSGRPSYFMPTYFENEGALFFLPSYLGDGSMDVVVQLVRDNVDTFKMHCYSLN